MLLLSKVSCFLLVLGSVAVGARPAQAQEDPVQVELDEFWAGVVSSVVNWNLDAQKATYHPDAIAVFGDSASYETKLMTQAFAEVEASSSFPAIERGLEFRFSSRVHDANTAHEVGLYRFWSEEQEEFIGTVDSYLVKVDGRWMILVEIQRGHDISRAEWDALE